MDTLDYTGPAVNEGSKGVWLGLGDPVRELPRQFSAATLPSGVTDVRVFCGGCLVVGGPAYRRRAGRRRAARGRRRVRATGRSWSLTDEPARAAASAMNFLWTTFTRFEPAADIHAAERRIVRNHIAYRGPIVIDARLKPGFPKELTCRDDIAQRVTRRWKEYFPSRTSRWATPSARTWIEPAAAIRSPKDGQVDVLPSAASTSCGPRVSSLARSSTMNRFIFSGIACAVLGSAALLSAQTGQPTQSPATVNQQETQFKLAAPAGRDSDARSVAPAGAINQGAFDPATWKYGPAFNPPAGVTLWNPVTPVALPHGIITPGSRRMSASRECST